MLKFVTRRVAAYAEQRGLEPIDVRRSIILDDSTECTQGCIVLIFSRTSRDPTLVAKAAPVERAWTRAGKPVYEIEADNLRELEQRGINEKRRTTPEPVGMWIDDGVLVTLQSALPGPLLKNLPGRTVFSAQRASDTIDTVLGWWLSFQRAFELRRQTITESIYQTEILTPLTLYKRRFVTSAEESRFLSRAFLDEQRLLGAELPFTVRHGDFCTANVILQSDGASVFDWEFPLRHQLPLYDLFTFFASTRFPFTGLRGESTHFDSFMQVFWGNSHLSRSLRASVRRVCVDLEIPFDLVGDLLLASLVQIANLKYERLLEMNGISEDAPGDADPSDSDKRHRWQSLGGPAGDVPFASIRDGSFENLRCVAKRGLPDFRTSP